MTARFAICTALATLCAAACSHKAEVDNGAPGTSVTSDPPGAEVSLDGKRLGRRTPAHVEAGEALMAREIELDLAGHVPFRQELPIGSPPAEVFAKLAPAAFVDVSSEPSGATISMAKVSVGVTPAKVAVPAGEPQQLSVLLNGFAPQTTTLTVAVGETVPWHVALMQAGTADFQSDPPGAEIVLDEVAVGRTPLQLPVSADRSHHVKLNLRGLSPCSRSFKVALAAVEVVTCKFDDAVGRRLKDRLKVTESLLEHARRDLERYEGVEHHYVPAMAEIRARNRIQDQIDRLTAEEDKEQGDLDAHRTELQDRFNRSDAGPNP